MRLGGFFVANSIEELEPLCVKLDTYGLSAIPAPFGLAAMPDDECAAFGERARALGLAIGEAGYWNNLMTADQELRSQRIGELRAVLRKADIMGCACVVSLVGTRDPSDHPLAPHPYMFTGDCRREFREVALRALEGLDLKTTRWAIEAWPNTFFYQPEAIAEFFAATGHDSLALHLDQMNMVSHGEFYQTTALINRTFDLLAPKVVAVHLKDIRWDYSHMFLKWDEVYIGDGVLDYDTYLKRIAALQRDVSCFCEHFSEERDYALNFARLHSLARRAGVGFVGRVPGPLT